MIIINCLGEEREPSRFYSNAVDCGFCQYPIYLDMENPPENVKCTNPACSAFPTAKKEIWIKIYADLEEKRKEEERRQQNHIWAMERIERERQAENDWRQEQIKLAKEKGACLNCLFQPGYQRVKFIKHRKECPK